jgi:hypothetical protein
MKKFVFTLLILSSFALNAQDMLSTKKLLVQYKIKLDLTKEQASNFVLVLEKFNTDLYKKDVDNSAFNKTNKLRDLEFYKLLNAEQYNKYKKVKLEIEPTLKFRFN